MGVAGVSRKKNMGVLSVSRVIERGRQTLADLVDAPPRYFFYVESVRGHDAVRGFNEHIDRHIFPVDSLVLLELVELDIHPDHVPTLTRDDQHVTLVDGLDRGL